MENLDYFVPDEVTVCYFASIAVDTLVRPDKTFDFKKLKLVARIATKNLSCVFTPEIIKDMAFPNLGPVIFVLSDPTSKAECTADQTYVHSDGRAVFASGSHFPTNAHIFPDTLVLRAGYEPATYGEEDTPLGVICTGIHHTSDSVFLSAAEGLADMVQDSDIAVNRLYPPLPALREISVKIVTKVAIEAYMSRTASTYPEP